MLRHAFVAMSLTLALAAGASADTISPSAFGPGRGFTYSAAASPFESFEWSALDLAAFAAYGGDFANVRRPVEKMHFFEDPLAEPLEQGIEDEQTTLRLSAMPYFEELPADTFAALPAAAPDSAGDVPEPGTLVLVGLGLLGASRRLRRAYGNR